MQLLKTHLNIITKRVKFLDLVFKLSKKQSLENYKNCIKFHTLQGDIPTPVVQEWKESKNPYD